MPEGCGESALWVAAYRGYEPIVSLFLKQGGHRAFALHGARCGRHYALQDYIRALDEQVALKGELQDCILLDHTASDRRL